MRVILGPREKNKDRDIPYNPLLMKPNKAGMSLYNVYAFVLLGSLIQGCTSMAGALWP